MDQTCQIARRGGKLRKKHTLKKAIFFTKKKKKQFKTRWAGYKCETPSQVLDIQTFTVEIKLVFSKISWIKTLNVWEVRKCVWDIWTGTFKNLQVQDWGDL